MVSRVAGDRQGIQSIEVGFRLLRVLSAASRPMMLRDIAKGAGMPAAKAHRYMVSFLRIGINLRKHQLAFHFINHLPGPGSGYLPAGRHFFVLRHGNSVFAWQRSRIRTTIHRLKSIFTFRIGTSETDNSLSGFLRRKSNRSVSEWNTIKCYDPDNRFRLQPVV